MAVDESRSMTRREQLALAGLRLPQPTLQRLRDSGIFCISTLSVARRRSTNSYVIRAHESGGAVAELGAYCGAVSAEGRPLPWLQRIDTIGVNGMHAHAIADSVVRIHVVRIKHTYDVLISKHELRNAGTVGKSELANSILFYGRQGTLELELWGKDEAFRGRVSPLFYDRGGDALMVPELFQDAVKRAVVGVNCCGCEHSHVFVPPDSHDSVSEKATPTVAEAPLGGAE